MPYFIDFPNYYIRKISQKIKYPGSLLVGSKKKKLPITCKHFILYSLKSSKKLLKNCSKRKKLLEVARTEKSCSKRKKLLKSSRAQSGHAYSLIRSRILPWPEMRDSQRNVLRAQNFAKFWSVSIIQPDIKGISSELRS
jgi:hypothetical protein